MSKMTLEKRKNIAETVKDFYLYPGGPTGESVFRIVAWMLSLLFGVVVPDEISAQTLGGCYFVLAISLLPDAFPQKRKRPQTKVIYGLFCIVLVLTALGAIILMTKAPPAGNVKPEWPYMFARMGLPCVGIGLFVIMLANLICVWPEVHKIIYDEEAEISRRKKEAEKAAEVEREATRAGFMDNLHGPSRGGDAQ